MEPEWGTPDPLVMIPRPCDRPSHLGRAWGWGQPHYLLIASFSESSFPPHLPLGVGDQVGSCPVLPHHAISGLGHSSHQGWALEAPGQRVPLPSAVHTRSLVGGTPKPFWEGLQRKVQPRPPQGWQPPSPPPGRLEKHSLTHHRLPSLPLPAFPPPQCFSLAQSMLLWPLVFFPDWRFPRGPPGE